MKSKVLAFISKFTTGDRKPAIEECFSGDCGFWFAYILKRRFYGTIMYDPKKKHFGCMIWDCIYDITGDVTVGHEWLDWEVLCHKNPQMCQHIIDTYINF